MKKIISILLTTFVFSCTTQESITPTTTDSFTGIAIPYPSDATKEFESFHNGTLSGSESTFTWSHTQMNIDHKGFIKDFDYNTLTTTTFNTIILENEFLKLTILPGYGGRILSMIYKPTGHEMLYQNPIGTPYLIGKNIFYYNYLMILGGIFPTFPDPEHGRFWNQPFNYQLIKADDKEVRLKLWVTDNIEHDYRVSPNYRYGKTGLTLETEIILRSGHTNFEYKITLKNNHYPTNAEYWTNIGFAPGSTPGFSKVPIDGTYIVAPFDKIMIKPWWDWLYDVEEVIDSNNHIYKFDRLKYYKNWQNQGIWYAYPEVQKKFWGVINRESPYKTGLLRVSKNDITTGMKFWSFGAKQGEAADSTNYKDQTYWLRPFPELWSGITQEFFKTTSFQADEVKVWSEFYSPIIGMDDVTYSNQHGSCYVEFLDNSVNIFSFINTPNTPANITILGDDIAIYNSDFSPKTETSHLVTLRESQHKKYTVIINRDDMVLLKTDVYR